MRALSVKVDSVTWESFTSSGHRLVSVVAFRKGATTIIPLLSSHSDTKPSQDEPQESVLLWDHPERSDKICGLGHNQRQTYNNTRYCMVCYQHKKKGN